MPEATGKVSCIKGKFYVVGEGTRMFTSANGSTRTKVTVPINRFYVQAVVPAQ